MSPKRAFFYAAMQHVQLSRQRNGAYGWSIARDIGDPELRAVLESLARSLGVKEGNEPA